MRFIVVVLLLVTTAGLAQKKKKDKEPPAAPVEQTQTKPATQPQAQQPEQTQQTPADTLPTAADILTNHFYTKYQAALRWNDLDAARSALLDVVIENPGVDSLIYTLAYLYYDQERYTSSYLIANDLLARQPKNPLYLEMAAVSAQQLGVSDKALQNYETLYLVNNDINTLYQIAFLQYNLKRYAECTASINILLTKPEVNTQKAVFNDAQGKPKEYTLKIPVLNLRGLVALDQNDKAGAKKAFTEALALAPDFVPAKENMEKTK